jgi:cytochrome b561
MYEIFNTAHIVTANLMLAIIAVHILAALKHALIDKDTVLARMLPNSSTRVS